MILILIRELQDSILQQPARSMEFLCLKSCVARTISGMAKKTRKIFVFRIQYITFAIQYNTEVIWKQ